MIKANSHTKYIFLPGLFLTALLLNSPHTVAASLYNIIDIGPIKLINNDYQNLRIKINDNNQVVGWHRKSFSNTSSTIGFSWNATDGFKEPLALSSEHIFSNSNANSTSGFIRNANGNQIASIWDSTYATQTNLGSLGGDNGQANAININNQVVGNSENANGIVQPFIWSSDNISLIPINNDQGGTADLINNNGWVAGSTYTGQLPQAYLWNQTELSLLSTINTDIKSSWASDLNNLNQVVGGMQIFHIPGSTIFRDLRTRAYSWDKTNGFKDLGQNIKGISWAIGINDNQQIVGGRLNNLQSREAILWENTSAFNLNDIILNIDDWELIDATDINNFGNIVGIGKRTGLYHAFLLEPSGGAATTSDLSINLNLNNANNSNNKARELISDPNQALKFIITNFGPDDASNIAIESTLDVSLSVSNLEITKGSCTTENQNIICSIPTLTLDESVELTLKLDTEETDTYQIIARVSADEIDAGVNPNNRTARMIKVTAQSSAQQSPSPAQSSSNETGAEDNSGTSPSDNSDISNTGTDTQKSSSGGCTVGNNQAFDPVLYLLLIISILKLSRSTRQNKQKYIS